VGVNVDCAPCLVMCCDPAVLLVWIDRSRKPPLDPQNQCRNLELLRESGAEIVFFSPLHDKFPEDIAAIYLGGGYPELYAADLSERRDMRAAVKAFAEAGGVVYAECGGLLYLSQSIQPLDKLPASMGEIPRGWPVHLAVRDQRTTVFEPLSAVIAWRHGGGTLRLDRRLGGQAVFVRRVGGGGELLKMHHPALPVPHS